MFMVATVRFCSYHQLPMRVLLLALTGLCALQLAAAQGRSLVDAMPCQLMGKQCTNPIVQPPLCLLGDLGPRHAAAARLLRPARHVPALPYTAHCAFVTLRCFALGMACRHILRLQDTSSSVTN